MGTARGGAGCANAATADGGRRSTGRNKRGPRRFRDVGDSAVNLLGHAAGEVGTEWAALVRLAACRNCVLQVGSELVRTAAYRYITSPSTWKNGPDCTRFSTRQATDESALNASRERSRTPRVPKGSVDPAAWGGTEVRYVGQRGAMTFGPYAPVWQPEPADRCPPFGWRLQAGA